MKSGHILNELGHCTPKAREHFCLILYLSVFLPFAEEEPVGLPEQIRERRDD